MKHPSLMSGEELKREAKRYDRQLGYEIDRLRLADERFRLVLDRGLKLDDEIIRRKNR